MALKDSRDSIPSYPRVFLTIARQKMNLSAEEVSRRLDVSKIYYYSIENGKRGHKITIGLLARIVEVLNLDANELIKDEVRYQNERQAFIKSKRKNK